MDNVEGTTSECRVGLWPNQGMRSQDEETLQMKRLMVPGTPGILISDVDGPKHPIPTILPKPYIPFFYNEKTEIWTFVKNISKIDPLPLVWPPVDVLGYYRRGVYREIGSLLRTSPKTCCWRVSSGHFNAYSQDRLNIWSRGLLIWSPPP